MARHASRRSTRFIRSIRKHPVVASVTAVALVLAGSVTAYVVAPTWSPERHPVSVAQIVQQQQRAVEPAAVTGATPVSAKNDITNAKMDLPHVPAPAPKFTPQDNTSSFNPITSGVDSRSAYGTIYTNADGTQTEASSPSPINFQKPNGTWAAINTSVSVKADGDEVVDDNPLDPTFAASSGDSSDYSVDVDGNKASFSLLGAATVDASTPTDVDLSDRGGSTTSGVAYTNVFPNQDLVYQVTNTGVDESLVLKSQPTTDESSWSWNINAPGMTLEKDDLNRIDFYDANGDLEYFAPIPVMWDSSGVADQSGPEMTNIAFTLSQVDSDNWTVTLTPDTSWLDSPDRVYPVFVDPSTLDAASSGFRSFESTGYSEDGVIYVGNSRVGSADTYWRTNGTYLYSGAFGHEVMGVELGLQHDGLGGANSFAGTVYVATAWTYYNVGTHLADYTLASDSDGGAGTAQTTELYNQVRGYIGSETTGGTLALTGTQEPGVYSLKQLDATLYVEYENLPTITAVSTTLDDGIKTSPGATGNTSSAAGDPTFQVSQTDPSGAGLSYVYAVSTDSTPLTDASPTWKSSPTSSDIVTMPSSVVLTNGTKYYWQVQATDEYGYVVKSSLESWTAGPLPTSDAAGTDAPADNSVVATTTPDLNAPAATWGGTGTLSYAIRLTTGNDGQSGEVIQSPTLTPSGTSPRVDWTVPSGFMQDGASYTWEEVVNDGTDDWIEHVNHVTIDTRVTNPGPAPTDTEGPVTVNLANGNLSASFTSPTVSTVGGSMGFGFTYNSQAADTSGLTGDYYSFTSNPTGSDPQASFGVSGVTQVMQRDDPSVDFDWGSNGPSPSVPQTGYMASWTGFLTPPTAGGTYTLGLKGNGASSVNGAAIYYTDGGGTQRSDDVHWASSPLGSGIAWAPNHLVVASGGASGTLDGNAVNFPMPITIDYYVIGSAATTTASGEIYLYVEQGTTNTILDSTWFRRTPSFLPGGWSASTALAGDSGDIVHADVHEGYITFVDTSGGKHVYTKGKDGTGYRPPPGENGVVSFDASNNLSFTDDAGTDYQFDKSGNVTSFETPEDYKHPAEPVSIYSGGELRDLADPLSGSGGTYSREIQFSYSTDAVCSGRNAPPGALCDLQYPDGSHTALDYNASGQLVSVVDPGGADTSFTYTTTDSTGLLSTIETATANDLVAIGQSYTDPSTIKTSIGYTGNQVTSVTLPAPSNGATRPGKTYAYYTDDPAHDGGDSTTVTGITESGTALLGTYSYNAKLQETQAETPSGLTTTQVWDPLNDDLLATIDPANIESSTAYDSLERPVATYGPAPSTCFSAGVYVSTSCSATPAHTTTTYDGGLSGLNEVYYGNANRAGAPTYFAEGGVVDADIAEGSSPYSGAPTAWSEALNGTVTFPSAGTYVFSLGADDLASLYVQGQEVSSVDKSGTTTSGNFVATAGETVSIQIAYSHASAGDSTLDLQWKKPGDTSPSDIPAGDMSPDYSLVTSTSSDDSVPSGMSSSQVSSEATSTSYGSDPWFGQVASTSVDPSGLDLTSTATYEPNSTTGYMRQLTSNKPADAATSSSSNLTTTTNTYYADSATAGSGICGLTSSVGQFGMLETTTGPSPATGAALTTSYIYDLMGRVIAEKVDRDSAWTCTHYDTRGRVSEVDYPSYGSAAARQVTYSYTDIHGNPLISSVSDAAAPGTSTATVNLLGQTVTSTDVWGAVTTDYYDLLGQLTSSAVATPSSVTSGDTVTLGYDYDSDGRQTDETYDGAKIASTTYDSVGRISGISYPSVASGAGNGSSLSGLTYSSFTGALTGEGWTFVSGTSLSDSEVFSQSGKVLQDTITDGSTPYTSTYWYDAADRLTQATVPDNTLTYAYASSGSCGADAAAGADGNRTGYTDTTTGGTGASSTPVSVAYCYDWADRLTSDTVSNAPSGASPLLATNLASTGSSPNLIYDSHGDITTLADQTMTYDETGRHISTSTSASPATTVTYTRDASDSIVGMETNISGGTDTTVRYAGGGGVQYTLNGSGTTVSEATISLPGGVTVSMQGATLGSTQVWSYPDLHGDDTVTADASGTRSTSVNLYDPFGDPIDLTTGLIGTLAANTDTPNNTTVAGTSYGWEGSHLKQDQTSGDIATIEMGDRQYVPLLGRFLTVDPVSGGNSNDYDYPNDPVDNCDVNGDMGLAKQLAGDDGGVSLPEPLEKSILAYIVDQARGQRLYAAAKAKAKAEAKAKATRKLLDSISETTGLLGTAVDAFALYDHIMAAVTAPLAETGVPEVFEGQGTALGWIGFGLGTTSTLTGCAAHDWDPTCKLQLVFGAYLLVQSPQLPEIAGAGLSLSSDLISLGVPRNTINSYFR